MNIDEDMAIRHVLLQYRATRDMNKAIKAINHILRGLRLDTGRIDMECYNCGRTVKPFKTDNKVTVSFDHGTPDTRITPGEPASVYLECEKCSGG